MVWDVPMELGYVPFFEVRPVISIKNMVTRNTVKLVTCSFNAHQNDPPMLVKTDPSVGVLTKLTLLDHSYLPGGGFKTPVPVNLNNLTSRKS